MDLKTSIVFVDSYTKEQMNLAWWEYDAVTYSSNFVSVVSKITDVETTFCNGQTTEGMTFKTKIIFLCQSPVK